MTMHLSYRHSIPVFDEKSSRRHESKSLWKLQLESLTARNRSFDPKRVECFAQFLGFPRSGHSLIGALIDAHPDARISHELDAMGLHRAGMGFPSIARLIDSNSRSFAANGKWWNGYSYAIDLPANEDRQPLVIGDKKGDWAVRWCAKTPGLLQGFLQSGVPQPKWLLVVRAPEDNIATMTLRRGGLYDRLRIKAGEEGGSASESIAQAQADGKLPTAVSDEMISDYRELCEGIVAMQELIPRDQWLRVDYETFTAAPTDGLKEIAAFLGLDPNSDWLAAASAAVRPPGKSRTRTKLTWSDAQNQAVAELKTQFSFLAR
ncbi:sulfotransferase family protein [Marinobacter fonticola]|uniref:sulfotransferase n=1 Tax=Marinobacter fonticola TaxID=2603215 RepID=UPI0011E8196F|nr:sulfotransferase [Marinobacter fonticola]